MKEIKIRTKLGLYHCKIKQYKEDYYRVVLYKKDGLFKKKINAGESIYFYLIGFESMANQEVMKYETKLRLGVI